MGQFYLLNQSRCYLFVFLTNVDAKTYIQKNKKKNCFISSDENIDDTFFTVFILNRFMEHFQRKE